MTKYLKFETPAQKHAGDLASDFGLENHGLTHLDRVYWNLPESALYEEAVFRGEGTIAKGSTSPFEMICIDFLSPLEKSEGKKYILIVVDAANHAEHDQILSETSQVLKQNGLTLNVD